MNFSARLARLLENYPNLLRRLVYASAGLVLAVCVLAALAIEREPVIWQKTANTQQDIAVTRSILHNSAKISGQGKDKVRAVSLSEEDLTALANFALARKKIKGFAQAKIDGHRMGIQITTKLPFTAFDGYLNWRLIADDAEPRAIIKQVKVGTLALPKQLVPLLGWWLTRTTHIGRYVQMTMPLLREVRVGDGRLKVVLDWDPEVMGKTQDLVADLADKERLRVYQLKLAEVVGQPQLRRFVSLAGLLHPLAGLAKQRSNAEGGDPREENRALILVLGTYANGKNLSPAIFSAEDAPKLVMREVLLNKRVDAAQHFTASAVLVIAGHKAFADMVGLAKEFNDTHGGSGFSFIDLAADRTGAVFGKKAVESEASARLTQDILSLAVDESAFMPDFRDLPENLGAEEFARQFGDAESPPFQEMKTKIEARIAACKLYQ
jgi:hypothetical protein